MFFNIFEILLIIIKIVICFHQHILECIINYIFVYTYWCIHILVWMLLQYICRLYTINEIVKPNDKPSNTNYVDLKMSICFFSFDIEHIKLYETTQLHTLSTLKIENKTIFIFFDVVICTNCSLKNSFLS